MISRLLTEHAINGWQELRILRLSTVRVTEEGNWSRAARGQLREPPATMCFQLAFRNLDVLAVFLVKRRSNILSKFVILVETFHVASAIIVNDLPILLMPLSPPLPSPAGDTCVLVSFAARFSLKRFENSQYTKMTEKACSSLVCRNNVYLRGLYRKINKFIWIVQWCRLCTVAPHMFLFCFVFSRRSLHMRRRIQCWVWIWSGESFFF